MSLQRRTGAALIACLCLLTAPVTAQQGTAKAPDPGYAQATIVLRDCVALAEAGRAAEAQVSGRQAEALFQARVHREPRDADALVGLARATSQCLLPAADFLEQGELSARAIELLRTALEHHPRHWTARFVLASIYLRSPAFLGWAPLAAAQLDTLLAQQGDRNDDPGLARTFELRGRMLSGAKRVDSARAVWAKGIRLFPGDSALAALLQGSAPSPRADSTAAAAVPATSAPAAPHPAALVAVRVLAPARAAASAAPSVREVTRAQVLMTPGGTADVLQAVQLQPGATRVTEGSDVYTRGGGASETALLVDGGRMLSLARFEGLGGGLFGALDPFVVKRVRYASGAFSARHGNALSGVLEIETDGRPREREIRAGLSMAQGSATVRAPLGRRAGAWASVRLANTGIILASHGRKGEFRGAPHSEELVASVIANPSPTSELRATVLVERDDARRIVDAAGWRGPFHSANAARALHVTSRWMPGRAPLVVRTAVTGAARASDWRFGALARDRDERALAARTDAEWGPATGVVLRGGVEYGRLTRGESGTLPTTGSVAPGAPTRALARGDAAHATQVGGYAEAELARRGQALLVGLRGDRLPGESRATMDPRLSLSSRRGAWTARVGGGLFHQGRWQRAPAIPDVATPAGAPRRARHLVAGLEREGITSLRVEAYDKRYGAYVPLGAGPQVGAARARGVDLLAQRALGTHVTGWIGYSYLDAEVRLRDGRPARSPFDVTHSATLSTTATLGPDWSVGTTARYGTGAPITPVVGATQGDDGRWTPMHGAPTSARLPDYARLDARVMRFVRAPAFLLTSFVEVLNVTGRANSTGLAYDATWHEPRPMRTFFASRTVVVGGELQLAR